MPASWLATDQGSELALSATSNRALQMSIPINNSEDFAFIALSPNLVDTGLVSQATGRVHQGTGMTTCAESRAESHRANGLSCRESQYREGTVFFLRWLCLLQTGSGSCELDYNPSLHYTRAKALWATCSGVTMASPWVLSRLNAPVAIRESGNNRRSSTLIAWNNSLANGRSSSIPTGTITGCGTT